MLIAITHVDGQLSVMTLIDQNASVDAEIEKWKSVNVGQYASHRPIAAADLPSDRAHRNFWRDNGAAIVVDVAAAEAAALASAPAPPTKAELLAKINALGAQINALA